MLPEGDRQALDALGVPYEVTTEDGFIVVTIEQFPVPPGLQPSATALLVRLPPGFPDAAPDMFWADPPVRAVGGAAIPGTEATQAFGTRTWQRWSRHIQGQWRPGIDNLATYLAYIRRCLLDAAGRVA
jgi:hypothetical protein